MVWPRVLAAADRDRHRLGDRAQPDLACASCRPWRRHAHRQLVAGDRWPDRKRERRACLRRLPDRALDRRLVAAEHMHDAVDHHLRRVDLAVAARLGIGALPVGVAGRAPACPSSRDSPSSRPQGSARSARDPCAISPSSLSAAGQDEQPWLVNSSITARGSAPAAASSARQRRPDSRARAMDAMRRRIMAISLPPAAPPSRRS